MNKPAQPPPREANTQTTHYTTRKNEESAKLRDKLGTELAGPQLWTAFFFLIKEIHVHVYKESVYETKENYSILYSLCHTQRQLYPVWGLDCHTLLKGI